MARILLIRHGPSAHPITPGLLDLAGVERWRAAYDAAGIAPDATPPAELLARARAARVVASDLPRAVASAACLSPGQFVETTPMLREVPLTIRAALDSFPQLYNEPTAVERTSRRGDTVIVRLISARGAADPGKRDGPRVDVWLVPPTRIVRSEQTIVDWELVPLSDRGHRHRPALLLEFLTAELGRAVSTHVCLIGWVRTIGMALACAVGIAAGACASDAIMSVPPDSQNRTIQVTVGQEIHITLGNVGPAEYESPPQISSPAISFLGVDVVPPFTPAGPTQQFRFEAAQRGVAAIHFRRLLESSVVYTVDDTVVVR